jgi:hypothetical protein
MAGSEWWLLPSTVVLDDDGLPDPEKVAERTQQLVD